MAPAPYLVTRRWIKERYQRWGPNHPMYRARALGEFPEQSEMSVYSLGWIERASREPDLVSRAEQRSYPGSASMWPDPARMKPRSWRRSAERSSRSSHGLCLIHARKTGPVHLFRPPQNIVWLFSKGTGSAWPSCGGKGELRSTSPCVLQEILIILVRVTKGLHDSSVNL